ncbi:Outer membrane receptor protein [Ignavibacterium album JCM 16511]|uniref:Outer membrane receptor protein n=1 Tax=Ignavibacterium album (strain DSM 19864 / JCM 16511 / NBRC 101810 / Mat9-16) TaxID=945713 RepID=I0AMR8_IGNAJ|nr:outer membrane beta-barrel family protein [Ignavibacterium album]AFH50275.1 Outer membrane receptor protein [Ignavibacterium album JCM 16511]
MIRLLLTLVVAVNMIAFAQSTSSSAGKIVSGVVLDSATTSALPFANITLHSKSDSSFVTGSSTDIEGEFELNNIAEGDYYLKISFVGYNTKYIPNLRISKASQKLDLGKITLSKVTYELDAAEVVGEKVSEELHLDKKVINVSQNLNAQGGNALDVLQNQPSVRVDPDGTVYLRGSSNFTVYVNGKPYPLQGSDALKQISASTIENIELITNPSSKYDAEGSAGIININLKAQKDYSMSGILNLNSGTGDKYNADGTVNYNHNGLSLNAGLDYRNNMFLNNQEIQRVSILRSFTQLLETKVSVRNKREQFSFRGGMDYTFNPKSSLGLTLGVGMVDIVGGLSTNVLKNQSGLSNYSVIRNKMEIPVKYVNTTLNYQYKFEPDVNDIYFEATYNYVDVPNDQLTEEFASNENYNSLTELISKVSYSNGSTRNEGRAKLNYKHKLSEGTTIETGVQTNYSFRNLSAVNKIFDKNLNDYVVDYNLTNEFDLRNNVYAGYVSFTSQIAEFNYMIGLRGEYMDRFLDQKTLSQSYTFEKMDFFPSVNVSRKIDDHQLQLSYSRRVNRPNENILNPFPFFTDPNISVAGNPKLKPEYIDAVEFNYQKMFGGVFFSAQTYYRKSKDSFTQTFSTDSTGKLNIVFNNYGNSDVYGAELSSSFSVAEIFKFDPSVNLFQTHLDGLADGKVIVKNFFNWSARLNATVTITPDTRFMLSGNYMKFVDAQSESEPFMQISASLRQEFFNKAMSLTLQARNLFKASDMKFTTTGSNFNGSAFIRPEAPVFSLIFSYNFNNFKRTQRANDNIDIPTGL